jgi:hypothetical protein
VHEDVGADEVVESNVNRQRREVLILKSWQSEHELEAVRAVCSDGMLRDDEVLHGQSLERLVETGFERCEEYDVVPRLHIPLRMCHATVSCRGDARCAF